MSEISTYLENPYESINNFWLGVWYEDQGHFSPASIFYMRAAEFAEDEDIAYESLLRLYHCYRSMSGRDCTCENALKSAINLKPKSPEAYFLLSQHYEKKGAWADSYLFASLGLASDHAPSSMKRGVGYESEYMMIFQKAVAGWWCGKPKESRMLFRRLKDEYGDFLNDYYFKLVEKNITSLGSGPDWESSIRYDKSKFELKFPFSGSEDLDSNFSQVCQDLFVLAALDGKRDGTYLEIGSAHSFHNSNTALLETKFGWTGVGIEMNPELANMQMKDRKNKVICGNALKIDYEKLLRDTFEGNVIDYLQLDIEPSKNTFEALLMIPFNMYKFRVITYEHDHYVDMTRSYREKSRRYLSSMGYVLLFNDIAPNEGCSFEDWWVREELVDGAILNEMSKVSKEKINLAKDVMLKSIPPRCSGCAGLQPREEQPIGFNNLGGPQSGSDGGDPGIEALG